MPHPVPMPDPSVDTAFSLRAVELALMAKGQVSPNPLVGCVIVNGGEIVGEGAYYYDRVTHAEVAALEMAGGRARGATAYVSLEPHDHMGRTRPCTEALIEAGIARVVCPIDDPNPLVSGRGFARLREAGIEVSTGLLATEASRANEKFICWHRKGRPFVHLKMAASLDGRISVASGISTQLSGDDARDRVQQLRHEYDVIIVGGTTAAIDDPRLTDRSGLTRRRPLVRVVLDNRLQIRPDAKLAASARETPLLVFTNSNDRYRSDALEAAGVEVIKTELGGRDLHWVMQELRRRDLQSILVEGGGEIAGAFIDAQLVDKVTFLYSPVIIGGRDAPAAVSGMGATTHAAAVRLNDVTVESIGNDIEVTGYPSV